MLPFTGLSPDSGRDRHHGYATNRPAVSILLTDGLWCDGSLMPPRMPTVISPFACPLLRDISADSIAVTHQAGGM